MRTVKWNPFLAGLFVVLGSGVLWAAAASADVSSTNPAAILVFPKLVADADDDIDTLIQITNTSSQGANVRCFYVNANGHCSDDPELICDPNAAEGTEENPCTGAAFCEPGWIETDFRFRLTPNQPVSWLLSAGLPAFPLAAPGGTQGGEFNFQSSVPPASEDPFLGELKCIMVGDDELPIDRNWLIGNATIGDDGGSLLDVAGYNAIGIQAIQGANNRDNTLVLGQEYNACPNIISLDHFFDDATDPVTDAETIRTELTFVPCSEDFNFQIPKSLVVQFLTYNEFEQRFSASRRIDCLTNIALSDIDTRIGDFGDASSIFNVAVQGTLTGQTLMRGVNDDSDAAPGGETFLLVAQTIHDEEFSGMYVGHQRGTRPQVDTIILPAAAPTGP
ncbi:MAG TPA: hypothetical protein VEB21_06110 [Terriglobales bacterium]|nr:hypothetical protein [Terriglobales bacterium]